MKLSDLLLNWEIPVLSERYRPWVTLFMLLFCIGFAINYVAIFHYLLYLGPGLGDVPDFAPLRHLVDELLREAQQSGHYFSSTVVIGLLVFIVLFRGVMAMWSYVYYRRVFGEPFPIRLFVTFLGMNVICVLAMTLMLVVMGIVSWWLWGDFGWGYHWELTASQGLSQWVQSHVPTLVELPTPLPLILVFSIGGLFHYWFHWLGHRSRFCWLLFHRPHHMTPKMIHPTTQPVFVAFPLFVVAIIPYTLVLGTVTKLFSATPLYEQVIILNLVFMIGEIFGHETSLYEQAKRFRLIRWLSYVYSFGVYHYMHHSSNPMHSRAGTNLVNLGGGFCFMWDHLFGTYTPLSDKRPEIGLIGNPVLHMNPFRLAFAGILQLCYEWKHNKAWMMRLKILAGPSDYVPPQSRDYVLVTTEHSHAAD